MTPEARLAAALHAAGIRCSPNMVHCRASHLGHAQRLLAADPTLAADLALAAAVRSQLGGWRFTGGDVRQALKVLGPPGTKGEGIVMIAADAAATISDDIAAIEEALRDG